MARESRFAYSLGRAHFMIEPARAWGRALMWVGGPQGRRWLLRALLAYAVIGFFVWIRRPGDFEGYLVVGNLVLMGRHIYFDAAGLNTWPPFFSLLCVPLALLAAPTPYLARGFWLLLNLALLVLVLRLIARLVYGREMHLRAESDGLSLAAPELLVPLLISDRFASGNFDHMQINIVVFALALGGLYMQARGRELAGGITLGCAAAIKVMPILFIPYLAYRRRWRAAAAAALSAAALSLSPILVFGWDRFWAYVIAWRAAVTAGWGVGKMNQSVFAMWDRLLGHRMLPLTVDGVGIVPESGSALVTAAMVVSCAVVTVLALWLFRGAARPDGWAALAEWSVVFIVGALFGPVCWKAYLVVLLLPNTVLFAVWRSSRLDAHTRKIIGRLLVGSVVLGALPSPGLLGKQLAGRLDMSSVVTCAALVILGASFWLRARLAASD
jgi:alpha-1,2-mannosyltransferase